MIITNKFNLPQAFVSMAQSDYKHAENEYRVTQLLKGIRETMLERRYADKIEQDVSDMVWLLFGTAVHSVLENQEEGKDELKETRVKINVGNSVLSGQFDLYNETEKKIVDYKTCSVYKILFNDFSDWRKQTLIYAYMMKKKGFEVEKAEIIAFMKDHKKSDAKFKPDYPKQPVKKITFIFSDKDFEEIEKFINKRISQLEEAERMEDDKLPLCTAEERYNSGDKYAVLKRGRKSALRVLNSYEEALSWKADNGGDTIEMRAGEDKKCMDYCSACQFCAHYKKVNNG